VILPENNPAKNGDFSAGCINTPMNRHQNIPMPFGKHHGKTINDVMEKDPSYLVWFTKNIRDMLFSEQQVCRAHHA